MKFSRECFLNWQQTRFFQIVQFYLQFILCIYTFITQNLKSI